MISTSVLDWLQKAAQSLGELDAPPEVFGFGLVKRELENGTRQWRFSRSDRPGEEIIVAVFPPKIGFPVHQHPHRESFHFLSPGTWTQGDLSKGVGRQDFAETLPHEPHGWMPLGDEPGCMIVHKRLE